MHRYSILSWLALLPLLTRHHGPMMVDGANVRRSLQGDDKCDTINERGDFGVLTGSTSLLEFDYQIEYNRFDHRIGDILQALEVEMVARLLPTIFGDDCNGLNRNGDMAPILGISARPNDGVSSKACTGQEGNDCQVLRGGIMLYQKSALVTGTLTQLRRALRDMMNDGSLNGTGGATRVSYMENGNLAPSASNNATICHATNGGTFGDVSNEGAAVVINFGYELELVPPLSVSIPQLLTSVEAALLDRLLPRVFPDRCLDPNDPATRRLQASTTVGLASEPVDVVTPDFGCSPKFVDSNLCQPIHGQLTVYPGANAGQVLSHIRQVISSDNTLRQAHPSIIDFRYFPMDEYDEPDDSSDAIPSIDAEGLKDSISELDTLYLALIIAAIVLVCLAVCCCCFWCCYYDRLDRRQIQKTKSVYEGATSDSDDDNRTPPAPRHRVHQEEEGQQEEAYLPEEAPRTPAYEKPKVIAFPSPSARKSPPPSPNKSDGYPEPPKSPRRGGNHPGSPTRTPRSVPTTRQAYHHSSSPSRSVPMASGRRPMGAPARLPQAPGLEDSDHTMNYDERLPSAPGLDNDSHNGVDNGHNGQAASSPRRQRGVVGSSPHARKGSMGYASSSHSSPRKASMGYASGHSSSASPRKGSIGYTSGHSSSSSPRKGSIGYATGHSSSSSSPRKGSIGYTSGHSSSSPRKGSIGYTSGHSSSSPRKGSMGYASASPSPRKGSIGYDSSHIANPQSPTKRTPKASPGENVTSRMDGSTRMTGKSSPKKSPRRRSNEVDRQQTNAEMHESASSLVVADPETPVFAQASRGEPLVTLPEAPYLEK